MVLSLSTANFNGPWYPSRRSSKSGLLVIWSTLDIYIFKRQSLKTFFQLSFLNSYQASYCIVLTALPLILGGGFCSIVHHILRIAWYFSFTCLYYFDYFVFFALIIVSLAFAYLSFPGSACRTFEMIFNFEFGKSVYSILLRMDISSLDWYLKKRSSKCIMRYFLP